MSHDKIVEILASRKYSLGSITVKEINSGIDDTVSHGEAATKRLT